MLLKHPELPWYYIKNIKHLRETGEWFVLNGFIFDKPGYDSGKVFCKVIQFYEHINVHNPLIDEAQEIYLTLKRWLKTDTGIDEYIVYVSVRLNKEDSIKKCFITEYNKNMLEEILNDR